MTDTHHKKIVKRIGEILALQKTKDPLQSKYIEHFYKHASEEYLMDTDVNLLFTIASEHWKFVKTRKKPRVVRVYNPTKKNNGWDSERTILEFSTKDTPFILDSLSAELTRKGYQIYEVMHPVLYLDRDSKGVVTDLYSLDDKKSSNSAVFESSMHFQISHIEEKKDLDELREAVENTLHFVDLTVNDWRSMRHKTDDILLKLGSAKGLPFDQEYVAEVRDFLGWLMDNNYIFLGYREYSFYDKDGNPGINVVKNSELGIFRAEAKVDGTKPEGLTTMSEQMFSTMDSSELLTITKSSRKSVVHRLVHMDYVGIKIFDSSGKLVGEHRILGLFTSAVYYQSSQLIPIIRKKIQQVIYRAGFPADSHIGKALVTALESYPRDELLQISEDDLFYTSMGIVELSERPGTRLFVRKDRFLRFLSCIVFLPRDRFNTRLREKVQEILEGAFNGEVMDYYTQVTESSLARMHVLVKIDPNNMSNPDIEDVEKQLIEVTNSWVNGLRLRLNESLGERTGEKLFKDYVVSFPDSYKDSYHFGGTYNDIMNMERAFEECALSVELYKLETDAEDEYQLKLYHPEDLVTISNVLPSLENMGFDAVDERTFLVNPIDRNRSIWLHHFRLCLKDPETLAKRNNGLPKLEDIKDQFQDALLKIRSEMVEDDLLNRLIIRAGLSWRDVMLLRALVKYSLQTDLPYSDDFIAGSLGNHPILTGLIVQYFYAKFDPAGKVSTREKHMEEIAVKVNKSLLTVPNVAEDRVIRQLFETVQAALRTNFFQKDENNAPKSYISFKLDSSKVPNLPLPRPFREIFVYSYAVEGIHLRGGKVARGGLRWSDRNEDFRTEVLGLVKAQMVKNAVIVPVGSKGGFVVKHPTAAGRDAYFEQGKEAYKTYLSGLLDITDNIIKGKIVPPKKVVRYDDDDPYLVVAADKGTATFSDLANSVSESYGFWLGDAFASGGSVGYDHKKMGITARGAWISVQRHFMEMGIDCQKEDFTCIGIGGMSGDVFGNGMLLSKHLRLVAAFNHLHIFIDPEPDAARSYKERQRLFKMPTSGWIDYDKALISKGGGVFERSAKSITLTPQIRKLLGVDDKSLAPEELIKALLRAEVDLLWNGGIGTYVKATSESNEDVGDKANDMMRINGREMRCKIVGEGGNLGFTQLGRIEYALNGGRVNTDAIDNSAGVDCSDHEVNIKIALGLAVNKGKINVDQRNVLLEKMTDHVAHLVLRDNVLQTLALTIDEQRGNMVLESKSRLMKHLEDSGLLDREVEFLPSDEDLARRHSDGQSLTRPELSVLLAYSKIELYDEILKTNLPEDKYFDHDLIRYFPADMREEYSGEIVNHQLKREIISTVTANSIVNRMGSTFFHRMKEDTGMKGCDIARSYTVARDAFDLRSLWHEIEDIEKSTPVEVHSQLYLEVRRLVERVSSWFLRNSHHPISVVDSVKSFTPGIQDLEKNLDTIISPVIEDARDQRFKQFVDMGVPSSLAKKVASMEAMGSACDIVHVASNSKLSTRIVGEVYFSLGKRLRLGWLRICANELLSGSYWENLSLLTINETLFDQQMRLTADVTGDACKGNICNVALDNWLDSRSKELERYDRFIDDLKKQEKITASMLTIAIQRVEALCGI